MKKAYLFLKKNGISISFVVGAVLSVLSIFAISSGLPEGATMEDLYATNIFDPAIYISYALIILTTIAALVGPMVYTIKYFKDSFKSLIMVVAVAALYFISVAMGATPSKQELVFFQGVDNQHLTADTVAYIDVLMIFTGITIMLTLGSLIFMGVWGFIKQR